MKRLLLTLPLVLAACGDPESELTGYWKSTDPNCNVLCGFTVLDQKSAHSNQIAVFDSGSFAKAASGPVIKIDWNDQPNAYVIRGHNGDFLIVLKDGMLHTNNGSTFAKERK